MKSRAGFKNWVEGKGGKRYNFFGDSRHELIREKRANIAAI